MSDRQDLLGGAAGDARARPGVSLRDILELTIKRALVDDESKELLGSESLTNALNALTQRPGGDLGVGFAPRREAEPGDLILRTPQYADAVAELLRAAHGEVALALFGDWGIGKTTLAKAIADKLEEQSGPIRYEVVRFSAWQYRRPPETWIFLYETFVKRHLQRTLPVWERFARTLRVNVARHGVLNLALLLSALGFALLTASLIDWKASLGSAAVLASAAAAIWTRAREPAKRLATRYAVLATHVEKLGMQATIGDDMRALLRAWLPNGLPEGTVAKKVRAVWSARVRDVLNPPQGEQASTTFALPFIKLSALLTGTIVLVWCALLVVHRDVPHDALLRSASAVILCIWVALCLLSWLALLQRPTDARRILLVVDDLDRCEPDETMMIMEAVKLLLDDAEMQERVQVLMLADERTFALATADKFERLISERAAILERNTPSLGEVEAIEAARSEVIREHREKLFLCHLRLGPLSPEEAADLGYRFSRPALKPSDGGPAHNGQSGEVDGETAALLAGGRAGQNGGAIAPVSVPVVDGQSTAADRPPMAEYERVLLRDRLAKLKASRQITPRNIRSLILRYQLARNLVRAGSGGVTPDQNTLEQILDALIDSTFDGRAVAFDSNAAARVTAPYVIAQVS